MVLIGRFNRNINFPNAIHFSYNAGSVTGTSFYGGLIGLNFGVIGNNFFIDNIRPFGHNSSDTGDGGAQGVSEETLRGSAGTLGANFAADTDNINRGFPILVSVFYGEHSLIGPDDPVDVAIAPVGEQRRVLDELAFEAGDPINLINGNFLWEHIDFELHGSNNLSFGRRRCNLIRTFLLGVKKAQKVGGLGYRRMVLMGLFFSQL